MDKASSMSSFGRSLVIKFGCCCNQYFIAYSPRSLSIFVYILETSRVTRLSYSASFLGILFKESRSSLTWLWIFCRKSFKIISIKLLGLLVTQFGPVTIGLNVRSLGFCDFIISDGFFLISLFMIVLL